MRLKDPNRPSTKAALDFALAMYQSLSEDHAHKPATLVQRLRKLERRIHLLERMCSVRGYNPTPYQE